VPRMKVSRPTNRTGSPDAIDAQPSPELTGRRLHRELAALGYRGGYTAVTDLLREIRPVVPPPIEAALRDATRIMCRKHPQLSRNRRCLTVGRHIFSSDTYCRAFLAWRRVARCS
jgi:hypothetical protein